MRADKYHHVEPRPPRKRVPTHGHFWLFTNKDFPVDVSEEKISKFFASVGLDISVACVSAPMGRPGRVLISLPYSEIETLVNWAINGAQMDGQDMTVRVPIPKVPGEFS